MLEESYLVLAEIELLICEALQLPPGSSLGTVDPQALCQVPAELIDALAVSVVGDWQALLTCILIDEALLMSCVYYLYYLYTVLHIYIH